MSSRESFCDISVFLLPPPNEGVGRTIFSVLSLSTKGSLYRTWSHSPTLQGFSPALPPRNVQGPGPNPPLYRAPEMFKVVHNEAQIVGKQAVGIQLKCFLVRWVILPH